MILEELFESFSLDLMILSHTVMKAWYFFASSLSLGLIDEDVQIKFSFCPDSIIADSDQACFCLYQTFFKTSESVIVDDLVSGVFKLDHWQSTENFSFSDWVLVQSFWSICFV